MKYKIGDKVRIKDSKFLKREYQTQLAYAIYEGIKLEGTVVDIHEISNGENIIRLDSGCYYWSEDSLEKIDNNTEINTDIVIKTMWEETIDGLDEVEVTTEIYCTECGHEFDTYDYDSVMIEDMNYCPFCGDKIRKVVYVEER